MLPNPFTAPIAKLHGSLFQRQTPEAVAEILTTTPWFSEFNDDLRKSLQGLARHRTPSSHYGDKGGDANGATYMPSTFDNHPGLDKPYGAAWRWVNSMMATLEKTPLPEADPKDARSLLDWSVDAMKALHMPDPDIRTRMNSEKLQSVFPDVSSRTYLKAVRSVLHLWERAGILDRTQAMERAIEFSKTRLASTITLDDFLGAPMTASFVAYYKARLARRTLFGVESQSRPSDNVSEALLELALDEARPHVIAKVLTRRGILSTMDSKQTASLLSAYSKVMEASADRLEAMFDSARTLSPLVVRKGDDSSAWNAHALAFNQARTGMLNLAATTPDLQKALEHNLPGKVPSLVAADLMRWYDGSGVELQDDTAVFKALPMPWDVVLHGTKCTRQMVEDACSAVGMKAAETGWTEAYRQAETEEAKRTPVSLHGVVLPDYVETMFPYLKSAGWFSGKN